MKIKLLPDHLINKIAAGEVVDRPFSVVKELVENSIDAGATQILIKMEGGGKTLIEVHDNGCGLSRQDALMAFTRHATSKIDSEKDLFALHSRGFRGEALPSIASVAKVILTSNDQSDGSLGVSVQVDGGKIGNIQPVPRSQGTTVQVRSLFFNTPVRRKFLRSDDYEASKIKQLVRRLALVEPGINFELLDRGKQVFHCGTPATFIERVKTVIRGDSVECHRQVSGMTISGVIGHPAQATSSLDNLLIYVNNRPINDKLLNRAVRDGFNNTLKSSEHPQGVILINLDPCLVDVNVHPQKSEVRFVNPSDVFKLVKGAVHDAFGSLKVPLSSVWLEQAMPQMAVGASSHLSVPHREIYARDTGMDQQVGISFDEQPLKTIPSLSFKVSDPAASVQLFDRSNTEVAQIEPLDLRQDAFSYSKLRYLGSILNCYLLFESTDIENRGLIVIDMHAAHERINFAILMEQFAEGKSLPAQALLVPYEIMLGEERVSEVESHFADLEYFGFQIEKVSDESLRLLSEPILPFARTYLKRSEVQSFLTDIASLSLGVSVREIIKEKLATALARVACHASIRSGYQIHPEEVEALCAALDRCDTANACPHGRPVAVEFGRGVIERWFGRDR
jgi:DNA mismatch repair protein MutL